MVPNSARTRILDDHYRLRSRFDAIERIAKEIIDGWSDDVLLLVRVGESMMCDLFDHMRWEDEHVAPVFRKSSGWGEDSAARLATDHREQRRMMRHEFERLRDPTIPIFLLARDLLDYLEILRCDMLDEERWMLDPGLLGNEGAKVEVRIE